MDAISPAPPALGATRTLRAPAMRAAAKSSRSVLLGALACVFAAVFVIAVGAGARPVAPGAVLAVLADMAGLPGAAPFSVEEQAIVAAIRLPRAILGTLVGAGLAIAGAMMQGLFRNPLADPALVGISNGAALAAAACIVLGPALLGPAMAAFGPYASSLAAFLGALAVTVVILRIASRDGRLQVATLLLTGIAINALVLAALGYLLYASDDRQLRDITFWNMGSLGGATWRQLGAAAPLILVAIALALRSTRGLNALILGERESGHLGFDVEALKRIVVAAVAVAVGAGVAVAGTIGFVGLIVPHLVRLAAGPDHRFLIPASALLGATLLLAADLAARTVASPAELPIGIVTSLVGGPFFLWLLIRQRNRGQFG